MLAVPVQADAVVEVKQGKSYRARIFPANYFSVRDKKQLTGRHVRIKHKRCTSATYSICDSYAQLSKLDGFDLQPRVTVPFTGTIKLDSVNDSDFFIATTKGKFVSALRQLTWDPKTRTLAGISDKFLEERKTYTIRVTRGIRDARGRKIKACKRSCVVPFTTRSASSELVKIRAALDAQPPQKLGFNQDGKDDVFLAAAVAPSLVGSSGGIVRTNQVKADASASDAFESEAVPNLIAPGAAGYFAFGSFMSPRYQFASADGHQDNPYGKGDGHTDGEIPPVPTKQTPQPLGMDRLGVIAVTPNPAQFPPPWPAAVYGPGFTRSKYDIFVSADQNAARGILTIATDPSGHAYGPKSTTTVTAGGKAPALSRHGRGGGPGGGGPVGNRAGDGGG